MMRCVIVGSAPFEDAAFLCSYLKEDDYIIAADGGLRLIDAMGKTPDCMVADFDSSHPCEDCVIPMTVLPKQKDDTDVLAAMRLALQKGYREFLMLGCLGGRFDHTLANVFLLRFLLSHNAVGMLVDERHEVVMLPKGSHIIPEREGYYLSLLPYGGEVCGVSVHDAEYSLEDAVLDTLFPIGVSNGFVGKPVHISIKDGFLLAILAKDR